MNVTTHCQKLTDERFVAMLFRVHVLGVPVTAGFMDVVVYNDGTVSTRTMHRSLYAPIEYNADSKWVVRLKSRLPAAPGASPAP